MTSLRDCVHPYPGKNRSSWISLKEGKALILLSFKFAQFYWFSRVPASVSWSFFLSWNQSLAGLSWCPCVIWTWRWGRNSDLDNSETCVVWMRMALWLLEFAKHLWRDRYPGLIFWFKGLGILQRHRFWSAWDGKAERLSFGDSVWISRSSCPISRSSTSLRWRVDLEVSLEEPFKNKWAVSMFRFLDKAESPAGKMQGAQRAKRLQSRPGGVASKEDKVWWLGLLVSSSLGFFSSTGSSAMRRQGDDQGGVRWSLRKLFNEELSALWQGHLKPSLIFCLAHKTVFKQQKVGEGRLWCVFFTLQSWDLSE